jgi:Na+/H+ antiporter NhaC
MQTDIGQKLTLLGLCAVIFYGVMLATGLASLEVMPQFLVSALVFVFSGRVVSMTGALSREREDDDNAQAEEPQPAASEEDWARLTVVFNWLAVIVILTVLALWVIKPQGVSLTAFVQDTFVNYEIYDELLSP